MNKTGFWTIVNILMENALVTIICIIEQFVI